MGSLVEEPTEQVVLGLTEPADESAVLGSIAVDEVLGAGTTAGVVALEAPATSIDDLERDSRVAHVLRRGTFVGSALEDSVVQVAAPERWATGNRGAGQVIVIVDTGVSPAFGGTVVGQACFAGTSERGFCGPDGTSWSAFDQTCFELAVCDADEIRDDAAARPCGGSPPPLNCQHGSAVAAVAARDAPTPGVAPDAGVYAIRVFDEQGEKADLLDLFLALDHVVALAAAGLDVAAVNLSVSSGQLFESACDDSTVLGDGIPAFLEVTRRLAARGVAVVAASGNQGSTTGIGFPACLSPVVAVGATDGQDAIAGFSNRSRALDLWAPGADVASGASWDGLDIPTAPGFEASWAGTSFAAPHVAGAVALVASDLPKATVAQRTWFLQASGVPIPQSDHRRLRLRSPASVVPGGLLFPSDVPGGGTRAAAGDFDGDGKDDLLVHGPDGLPDLLMFGAARWEPEVVALRVAGDYRPVVGNFQGQPGGPDEILWYAPGPAADSMWAIGAGREISGSPVSVGGTYRTVVGDFDGDGWDDVLWYAPGPAKDSIWYGGATGFSHRALSLSGTYEVLVGDFDGDRRDDLFFLGGQQGPESVWRATPERGVFRTGTVDLPGALVPAVADLDADGREDILLHGPGPTQDRVWRGASTVADPTPTLGFDEVLWSVSGSYRPILGDVDRSGTGDVIWYAPGPAPDSIWLLDQDLGRTSRAMTVSGAYEPIVADLDGDGGSEVLWFAPSAGRSPLWWAMP